MRAEIKQLQSESQKLKDKIAKAAVGGGFYDVGSFGDYKVLPVSVSGVDMNALRNLGDEMKTKIASGVVILASDMGDKVNLIVMATDDAVKAGAHAGNIIKKIAPMVGGGGGGGAIRRLCRRRYRRHHDRERLYHHQCPRHLRRQELLGGAGHRRHL